MKTARFSELVARCGRPEVHLTWTAPSADHALQALAKKSRVLTVHQHVRGAKKDSGAVGLEEGSDSQFLVFPKSLSAFRGRRIVGIDYDLVGAKISVGAKAKFRAEPSSAKREKAETKTPKRARAETPPPPLPFESEPEENDPIKAEIRRALIDLSVGDTAKAKRRLAALLKD